MDDEYDLPPEAHNSRASSNKKKQRNSYVDEMVVDMGRISEANVVPKELRRSRSVMGIEYEGVSEVNLYKPYFTYTMIVVNTIMFVITMFVANWQFDSFTNNPMIGPTSTVLDTMGAKDEPELVAGQWWRLFSPMFLHAGVIHLGMNMFMLYRVGSQVEEGAGLVKTAIIYFSSGVSGVLASCVFNPTILGVGASGALYGLLGGLFGDFIQNYKIIANGKWCYFSSLVFSLVFGLLIGLLPIIDNWAHIGGFVVGVMTGTILLANTWKDDNGVKLLPWYSRCATLVSAILLLVWFIVFFAITYSNKTGYQYCTWCSYLDCVNISPSLWTCP